jgi:serine/threonine protein kinase
VGTYLQGKTLAILLYPVADFNLESFLEYVAEEDADNNIRMTLRQSCGCLIHALDYIHVIKIKHMDIKPQNVLVKQLLENHNEYRYYITDFGISRSFTEQSQTDGLRARTPKYCSPTISQVDQLTYFRWGVY